MSEIEIENQSYQVLGDVEKQLREAREAAEVEASRCVNSDMKAHIARLKRDVEHGEQNKDGSKKMIDDLRAKYQEVAGNFESFL